jgi:hypothetical protein
MNQILESGISAFASGLGLAIIFFVGRLCIRAFNFLFDSKPKAKEPHESTERRTTGIIERPFSRDEREQRATPRPNASQPSHGSTERSPTKSKKIAVAIAILALVFVPTQFCPDPRYGCLTSGWDFIFNFDSDDRVDIQRMLIQLVVAGIICALLLRKKS